MPIPLFESLHPVQKAAFQRVFLGEKPAMINGFIMFVREFKFSYLKEIHPGWTEEQLHREVARFFLHASAES